MRSAVGASALVTMLALAGLPAAAQARPGDLYVGSASNGKVVRVSHRTGHQSVVASGGDLSSPDSGAFTDAGRLVIADYSALGGTGAIFKINVHTGNVNTLASGGPFAGPTDVTISPGGRIFADDPFAGSGGLGAIFRIHGGGATLVSDGQKFNGGPLGLAFTPGGNILTTDQDAGPGGSGSLIKVNPQNGHQTFVTKDHKLQDGYGMTLSPRGKVAYVADDGKDAIVRVKVATGAQKVVAKGNPLNGPTDVALGLDGKLYVANDGSTVPKIIKIDRKTGKQHVFAKGGKLDGPEGITVQPRH